MKIVAVISEFDPFHAGHAALFSKIRARLGEDTAIIAVMSGNFLQRGRAAMFTKQARARMATGNGADLVLELPFPYSASGAERFSRAGVSIATSLGVCDYLAFGSECGDTEALSRIAERMNTPAYISAYERLSRSPLGCAAQAEAVYTALFGDGDLPLLREPNNLLALEYIRALLRENSSITPLALLREGTEHGACADDNLPITSATEARALFSDPAAENEALARLPAATSAVIKDEIFAGKIVADEEKLLDTLMMFYRFAPERAGACASLGGGLLSRVCRAANEAKSGAEFFERIRTKKYTDAYLRRALLYGFLNISKEALNSPPAYTQVLAHNTVGRKILARCRKEATIPLITKPADARAAGDTVAVAAKATLRADSLYCALLRTPMAPCDLLRYAPFCENGRSVSTSSPGQALDNFEKMV